MLKDEQIQIFKQISSKMRISVNKVKQIFAKCTDVTAPLCLFGQTANPTQWASMNWNCYFLLNLTSCHSLFPLAPTNCLHFREENKLNTHASVVLVLPSVTFDCFLVVVFIFVKCFHEFMREREAEKIFARENIHLCVDSASV